jgi:hypothetical protein
MANTRWTVKRAVQAALRAGEVFYQPHPDGGCMVSSGHWLFRAREEDVPAELRLAGHGSYTGKLDALDTQARQIKAESLVKVLEKAGRESTLPLEWEGRNGSGRYALVGLDRVPGDLFLVRPRADGPPSGLQRAYVEMLEALAPGTWKRAPDDGKMAALVDEESGRVRAVVMPCQVG